MQTIKKYWAYFIFVFAILFFIYNKINQPKNILEARAFHTSQGWGYEILHNKKVYIHQQIIPAIQGQKYFVSKEEAEKVAALLIKKMQEKTTNFPEITIEEIDSLKITR